MHDTPNGFSPKKDHLLTDKCDPAKFVTKVFYSQYKGVVEYQLSTYNKSGLLLFETNNIGVGWNGYKNSRLVSPEVNISKARENMRMVSHLYKQGM